MIPMSPDSDTSAPFRHTALVVLSLLLPSLAGVALVGFRFAATYQTAYFNLIWNLFLAWLPLIFAVAVYRFSSSRWLGLGFAFLWLLFLPNSPYLVTDLVHLKPRPPVPLWLDILIVQLFVLLGLVLGFLSLQLMHRMVSRARGARAGWGFTLVILGLTAFGVYLGRFERWNSWDLFVSPLALSADILNMAFHPHSHRTAVVFSSLGAGFLFLGYLVFHAVTASPRGVPTRPESS